MCVVVNVLLSLVLLEGVAVDALVLEAPLAGASGVINRGLRRSDSGCGTGVSILAALSVDLVLAGTAGAVLGVDAFVNVVFLVDAVTSALCVSVTVFGFGACEGATSRGLRLGNASALFSTIPSASFVDTCACTGARVTGMPGIVIVVVAEVSEPMTDGNGECGASSVVVNV